MSAVIFEFGLGRFELPADEAERLRERLRRYDDPSGHAWDIADRIARAGPLGHSVYPSREELVFLLGALREAEGSLSEAGADLLRALLRGVA